MFYTTYRPQKFSDLVGLESLSHAILSSISSNRLAHAYFFYGPRGTGKTSVARLLAKAVNCEDMSENAGALDVCGECSSCTAIEKGRFLDLIEIDAASNRGIDDIRSLKDKISLAPTRGKAKVYIIDEVHMLTAEAFNALLKTLEEPPQKVYFVLCTTEPQKVPDTIKSRCVKFEFKRASEASIIKKLRRILEAEGRSGSSVSDEDLKKISRASVGGFRDAETLLEEALVGKVSVDEVIGRSGNLSLDDFIDSLKSAGPKSSLEILYKVFDSGVDLTTWCIELLRYLRALLLVRVELPLSDLDLPEEKVLSMKSHAAYFKASDVIFLLENLSESLPKIKGSVIPTLPLEIVLVKWFGEDGEKSPSQIQDGPLGGNELGEDERWKIGDRSKKTEDRRSKVESGPSQPFEWGDLLAAVKPHNHSVEALLKSCRFASYDGESLYIEVYYSFHKERLESPKNREIVEGAIREMLGKNVRVKCLLGKKGPHEDLKDAAKGALEVFDGKVEV